MRNKILSIALAFVTLVGLVPLTATTAEASDDEIVEITTAGTCNYDYANEVAELVNEERAAAGLNTLVNDKRLTEWAMQRAAEQAFYFGHVRPDGTGWTSVTGGIYDYPYYYAGGENAAGNYTSPSAVMNGWMNSAGHKATLMDEGYTAVGVGCVKMGGYTYWIQIFAGPSIGAGGDYEIIESTYSGTKEQTFTISIYASYLHGAHVGGVSYEGVRKMVGKTSTIGKLCAINAVNNEGQVGGVIVPAAVSDVKDESTGEVIATASVASDGTVTITPSAVGSGYLYLYAYEGASPISVKVTTYKGKTVTFDSCGGSSVSSQTVEYYATEPETPTRNGYNFAGWYTAADGGTKYEFDEGGFLRVESDVTLYAHWTANTTASSGAETTKTAETTTAAPETTTKAEETTKAAETTKGAETTASPTETTKTEETTGTPSEDETTAPEETMGTPDEETTEEPDEETTDDATETTETETETEDVTETTETETATEGKTETDGAVVVNNGDNNGSNSADEENGSYAWAVVLVVVLVAAAATVTVIIVLKKEKNDEDTSPSDGDGENDSTEE
ncbi:MAG: InlB B-repeat-containing protein [Firmicutes bacterium]|nr:InlB B-repeat-containing protein [Bacillota bacterium]